MIRGSHHPNNNAPCFPLSALTLSPPLAEPLVERDDVHPPRRRRSCSSPARRLRLWRLLGARAPGAVVGGGQREARCPAWPRRRRRPPPGSRGRGRAAQAVLPDLFARSAARHATPRGPARQPAARELSRAAEPSRRVRSGQPIKINPPAFPILRPRPSTIHTHTPHHNATRPYPQDPYASSSGAANGNGAGGGYQKTGMTGQPVSTDGFLSAADYKRQHDIAVQGDHVPEPLQTFESVGFPPDILEEVRAATARPFRRRPHR